MSDAKDSAIMERKIKFGNTVLGPVIAGYLHTLLAYIQHFRSEYNARILFVSRSGIGIKTALERYCFALNMQPPEEMDILWLSRLMAAKGCYESSPEMSVELISDEYRRQPLRELVEGLFKYDGIPTTIDLNNRLFDSPGEEFGRFIRQADKPAVAVAEYLQQQSALFTEYISRITDGYDRLLLVDTGWQGTAQSLLSYAFPGMDWWGIYFGRFVLSDSIRNDWRKVIGIHFEQNNYTYNRPSSSIILFHHLIESLFEINGPSIERLARNTNDEVYAPEAELLLAESNRHNPLFTAVMDYIDKLPVTTTPAAITRNAAAAWQKLSRFIVLPVREEAELFLDTRRDANFGKDLVVPVITIPVDRDDHDSSERRITEALWKPGQIALEYPPDLAEPMQRKFAGLGRDEFTDDYEKPEPVISSAEHKHKQPKIAVITRTLDRPVFLKRALHSVASQTCKDYLHVIVNDGGKFHLVEETINNTLCDKRKILAIDNIKNRGMEASSNIGIHASQSEYIVIHDDDDSWEPDFLKETITFLDDPGNRHYGGVITKSRYVSEEVTPDGLKIHGTSPYQEWVENVHLMEMAIGNFYPPIAFVFRRELYNTIGGFDESFPVLGDWDFNLRFLLESDIGIVGKYLANYHHRDINNTEAFGNTVISGRNKHLEYSAIVRNKFARNAMNSNSPAAAVLVGLGLHFGEQRNLVRNIANRGSNISSGSSPSRDRTFFDTWVALQRIVKAVSNNDKPVLKKLGINNTWKLPFKNASISPDKLQKIIDKALMIADRNYQDIEAPPGFSEERYLKNNPDVARAVKNGDFKSGFHHYILFGRTEGRV